MSLIYVQQRIEGFSTWTWIVGTTPLYEVRMLNSVLIAWKILSRGFSIPWKHGRDKCSINKEGTLSGTWSDEKRHERRPWVSGTAFQLQKVSFNSKLPRASCDQEQLPGAVPRIYKPKEQSNFNALLQDPVYYNLSSKRSFCLLLPEEDWLATATVFYQIFLNTYMYLWINA